ncbi:hypothetical protein [Phreatobacter sp.]|uniref:hypothetical protein n=1 Tax=Phreatobacter sp. TaxID=1966341 RepID=UPI003F6EC698
MAMTLNPSERSMPVVPQRLAAAALAAGLSGCAAMASTSGELSAVSPMTTGQLADCVAQVFDRQVPLVRRRSWPGGAEIVVRGLHERPLVIVTIAGTAGGSTLRLVAERPGDRRVYWRLVGNCVRLPRAGWFG